MTGLSRRDRQILDQFDRDLATLRRIAPSIGEAIRRGREDAVGVSARRYDLPAVRAGGRHGDPTAARALAEPDRIDRSLAELLRSLAELGTLARRLEHHVNLLTALGARRRPPAATAAPLP